MKTKKPTLKDVAQESGVSPSTVSFVLNDAPNQTIPRATQERVRAAAKALGYRPNRVAKTLREGSSDLALINLGSAQSTQSMDSFLQGIEDVLTENGLTLIAVRTADNSPITQEVIETLAPRTVIDLSLLNYEVPESLPNWEGGWAHGMAAHAITQMRYVAEKGHHHVGFAQPAAHDYTHIAERRFGQSSIAAQNFSLSPLVELRVGVDRESTASALQAFRSAHPEVTAIACYSDDVAFQVLAAMNDLGLSCPQDLAVVGFDESPSAAYWSPALTTVRIYARAHGHRVARISLGLEPGELDAEPSEIVVGGTC